MPSRSPPFIPTPLLLQAHPAQSASQWNIFTVSPWPSCHLHRKSGRACLLLQTAQLTKKKNENQIWRQFSRAPTCEVINTDDTLLMPFKRKVGLRRRQTPHLRGKVNDKNFVPALLKNEHLVRKFSILSGSDKLDGQVILNETYAEGIWVACSIEPWLCDPKRRRRKC